MTSLYTVASEYRSQLAALSDLDMPPEVVFDTVESIQGDLTDKLRAVIAYSLELDILAAGASDAAKRMQDRAKTLTTRVEWLRSYALKAMQDTGIGEVSTDEFGAKIAKKPASVNVSDTSLLPPAFWRQAEPPAPAPDKTAIAAALKAGALVPGAELVQGFRLAIR
jgi:hypothetical protein